MLQPVTEMPGALYLCGELLAIEAVKRFIIFYEC